MKTTIITLVSALVLSGSPNTPLRAQQDVLGFTASPYIRLVRGGPPTNAWLQLVCIYTKSPVSWGATVNPDVPDQAGRSLGAAASAVSVQPPSGQFPVKGPYYVPLSIEAASSSQLKGVYHGTVTFNASGAFDPSSAWNPSINLNLGVEYAADNSVNVYPFAGAYFSRVAVGATASQQLTLINNGPDHLYQWRVTVGSGGTWLSVSSTAGDEIPTWQDAGYSRSQTNLTLTVNAAGLSPGHYACTLVITADNLKTSPFTCPVQLDVEQAYVVLDQRVAARGTVERITINGQGFTSGSVPSFLKNGSPDANLALGNLTISPTLIQADLSVSANADLGPRTLKVVTGNVTPSQMDALDVISICPELSQGTTNTLGKRLVANHPTVLRAFVQNGRQIQNIDGLLYVFNGEQQMAGSPFAPNAPSPHSDNTGQLLCIDHPTVKASYSDTERFYLRDSLNFYFGRDLPGGRQIPAGDWDFFVALSVTNLSESPPLLRGLTKTDFLARKDFIHFQVPQTQTFRTTKPLRVLALVDYRLHPRLMSRMKAGLRTTQSYLGAVYPVDGTKVWVIPVGFSPSVFDIDALKQADANGNSSGWYARVWAELTSVLEEHNRRFSSDSQCDRVALVSSGMNVAQIAEDPGTGGITCLETGAIITSDSMTTCAHELGHACGLGDTYASPTYTNLINPIHVDARPDGNPVENGAVRLFPTYDVRKGRPLVGVTACVAAQGGPPLIWGIGVLSASEPDGGFGRRERTMV
jgi:hypothetical protein